MTTNRKTDEILIKEFQNGDRNAYTQLVTRYRDKIIRFLYRYMQDMDSAEDLAQEAFFKVYLKKDSYKETYKFSTWLFTIASNLAKTELRKLKRRKTSSISDIIPLIIEPSFKFDADSDSDNSDSNSAV